MRKLSKQFKNILICFLTFFISTQLGIRDLLADSKNYRYYFEQGIDAFEDENYYRAIINFNKAIELNPNDPNLYVQRGRANKMDGNLSEAMNDYSYAIKLDPKNTNAFYKRSWLKVDLKIKDYDGAILDMRQTIILDPYNVELMEDLSHIYYFANKIKSGIKILNLAIDIEPENGNLYYWRGTYKNMRSYPSGCRDIRKSKKLKASDYERGYC